MEQNRLKYLLERYSLEQCDTVELQELNEWFHAHNPGKENIASWIREAGGVDELSAEMLEDFKARVARPSTTVPLRRIWVAAAVLLLISAAGLFFYTSYPFANQNKNSNAAQSKTKILPGGNNAILTLADGKQIALNQASIGKLTEQNDGEVSKLADSSISYHALGAKSGNKLTYNTLHTPRGGKYNLVLADGTQVSLDAESSITFPVAFSSGERRVKVSGQVYFHVIHDAAKPFYVEANGQLIEDLGTAFNINAYQDDQSIKITLAEGLINVSNAVNHESLVPGQQATVKNGEQKIEVKAVNVEDAIAWKNGWFAFRNETIQNVMKQAARWYDVEVVYEGKPITKRFGGKISKYDSIDELLENLKITGLINYKIKGRRVILTR